GGSQQAEWQQAQSRHGATGTGDRKQRRARRARPGLKLLPLRGTGEPLMRRSLCLSLALVPLFGALVSSHSRTASAEEAHRADAAGDAARAPNVAEAEQYAAQAFDAYSRKEYGRALELYQ